MVRPSGCRASEFGRAAEWREEVIYEKGTHGGLTIFTTNTPTTTRIYTLAQNPLYRNDMTTKGYLQSRHTDYFLGNGMSTPPKPNIQPLNFGSNAAPTVATAAAASPGPVTGTSVNLSVLGADDGGAANLTYTWAGLGPAATTFSANGTNAANDTTATFSAAGAYTFVATIRDAAGRTTTSRVNVAVNQTLTGVTVSPDPGYVNPNGTKQFTATGRDQFAAVLTTQPTFAWSVIDGGGTIDSAGLYTAPGAVGSAAVRAAAGPVSGTASVTITTSAIARAWWKLNENGGTAVSDSSGNGYSGAASGPSWTAGKFSNALSFDGADDYVSLPNSIANSAAGSVSMWIKTGADFADAAHLFYTSSSTLGNGGGAENELHVNFVSRGRLQFFIKGGRQRHRHHHRLCLCRQRLAPRGGVVGHRRRRRPLCGRRADRRGRARRRHLHRLRHHAAGTPQHEHSLLQRADGRRAALR